MYTIQHHILRVVCVFWLVAKGISFTAWSGAGRLFPVIPAFGFLENVPAAVHTTLFCFSLAAMILLLLFPKVKTIAAVLVIVEVSSCLLDVVRWQPWEYQYLFITTIFLMSGPNSRSFYSGMVLITVSVYIFSGLHKLNGGFLYTIWESMILKGFFNISTRHILDWKLHYTGLLLPVVEAAAGLGLLFTKSRKAAAVLLMVMHMLLLILLGPWGLDYNIIVWPWNVAMIIILYLLFFKNTISLSFATVFSRQHAIVLLFWGVLPIFSFTGHWDSHFSSSLYPGDTKNLAICISNKVLVPGLSQYFTRNDRHSICDGGNTLSLQKWAFSELNLPPYPEEWYYRRFKNKWEKEHPGVAVKFYIYAYPYRFHKEIR
jgi:hypothetical protein